MVLRLISLFLGTYEAWSWDVPILVLGLMKLVLGTYDWPYNS